MASVPDVGLPPYLYVIEIGRGRIKVGYTVDPRTRLAAHRGMALAHGCTPGREWTSPPGAGSGDREAALIAFCAKRARAQFRNEYFAGLNFRVVVRHAAKLCEDTATLRALADEPRAARLAAFRAALDDGATPRLAGSAEEAARWLRLPETRIRELMDSGELPVIRLGSLERIPTAAIERLIR